MNQDLMRRIMPTPPKSMMSSGMVSSFKTRIQKVNISKAATRIHKGINRTKTKIKK